MTSKELWERLEAFPKLKARVEQIVKIAENSTGEIERADDAEDILFEQGRQLTKEALEEWAQTQATMKSEQFSKRHKAAHKDTKKKIRWHTRLGEIEVQEQVYRLSDKAGTRIRPFSESALVTHCSYSRGLQRTICDFGADHSFGEVNAKLMEHYGIQVPTSAARSVTEYHAAQMSNHDLYQVRQAEADVVIGESDGSMIPIVEIAPISEGEIEKTDRRKKRTLGWKEARLTLAHAKNSTTPCFAGTIGSVETAGEHLVRCVDRAGAHAKTHVYCIGDGAPWIANQVEEKFGARGHYLIDFYHLCEYLSAAATYCAPGREKTWMESQKKAMKENRSAEVLVALRADIEPVHIEEANAPVRTCHRYIKNRLHQVDYQYAIANELPIGSGEIESAHRYVLQKRLKIAGAWWKLDNAKHMISLRVCRANNRWTDYWRKAA